MKTTLYFNSEDECLEGLTGTVSWPHNRSANVPESLTIRGLGNWRHFPANLIAVNDRTIQILQLTQRGKNFAKAGCNWVGLESKTDIMLSKALRTKKVGKRNVINLLKKFFLASGACGVSIK